MVVGNEEGHTVEIGVYVKPRLMPSTQYAESPKQALTLLSEDDPNFIIRALSETLPRSLGVQDFTRRPPYYQIFF